MSLVLYSVMLFYPGGGVASGAHPTVHLHGSNQAPLLFTDSAGTTPASNPMTADSVGVIQFYAAPGHYMAELAGDMFYIPVDESFTDPVWQDLWVHTQATAETVWTIAHHFGVPPSVDVVLDGGVVETAEVGHVDSETTTITFGAATAGTAYLRR